MLFYLAWIHSTSPRVAVCGKYDEWYDRYETAKWGDSTSAFNAGLSL